tara:strand:+ start:2399 stop:2503 length:105 start_codon:yes stop_codon:yes gene_type:complete
MTALSRKEKLNKIRAESLKRNLKKRKKKSNNSKK